MKDLGSSPKIKTCLIVHTIDVKLTKPRVRVLTLSFQATYLNKGRLQKKNFIFSDIVPKCVSGSG